MRVREGVGAERGEEDGGEEDGGEEDGGRAVEQVGPVGGLEGGRVGLGGVEGEGDVEVVGRRVGVRVAACKDDVWEDRGDEGGAFLLGFVGQSFCARTVRKLGNEDAEPRAHIPAHPRIDAGPLELRPIPPIVLALRSSCCVSCTGSDTVSFSRSAVISRNTPRTVQYVRSCWARVVVYVAAGPSRRRGVEESNFPRKMRAYSEGQAVKPRPAYMRLHVESSGVRCKGSPTSVDNASVSAMCSRTS